MAVKIALAGNPNSGKTTLFNQLTGSTQFVGNWPGVTVEKKEGMLKAYKDHIVVDLPGIYSLSPYTLEEVVARNYLINERPDVILNIIDGTNLERNLYLSTQLMELGIPMVIAINMMDVVVKSGDKIHIDKLSKELGIPILEISALKGEGITEVVNKAISISTNEYNQQEINCRFSDDVEKAIDEVENKLDETISQQMKRFFAIKVLESDSKIADMIKFVPEATNEIHSLQNKYDDDIESIIINERYNYIEGIVKVCCEKNKTGKPSISERIDNIVTNRILALPIFAIIIFSIYYISVSTVGTIATDWANDGVFGEGWNLFGMWIPGIPVIVESGLNALNCTDWLQGLILDGIIGGVGAVLGFVPQIVILFIFLAFLEGCGYMARVAFIMDKIFRKFGLSGKSFIPMLVGTGCGVPGIMASRTIENDRDRKMTIMTTTFIPCGAKLPIIALIAGAMFGGAWWVAPSAYFMGIFAVVISGIMLKKTKLFAGDVAPFVMELPPYHMPTAKNIFHSVWERSWSFVKKAGTVVMLSTMVIWFTSNFGIIDGQFMMVEDLKDGLLANLGKVLAPVFIPLGWGEWELAVATITGLIAKENVVGTLGVLYGFAEVGEAGEEIWANLGTHISSIAAYSFLVFNLLCAPCFAAIGAIKREMNNNKWFAFAIVYQTGLAYAFSLCIYQAVTFIMSGNFTIFTAVAIIITIGLLYFVFKPAYKQPNNSKSNNNKSKDSVNV